MNRDEYWRPQSESLRWRQRAEQVIAGGAQTLSKAPRQWMKGILPLFLSRGEGGHVWDVDGNEWIDFPMALGPVLLGHAEPAVNEAINRQLRDGVSFTLMHPLEVEVAERIVAMCPGVDAVRFAKTGSDATSAAVRVARARTGRERVLVCGYHGWHDWYAASTSRRKGIPAAAAALVRSFPFNDLARLSELLTDEVAAVILEPSGAELPRPGFLEAVVERCRLVGAVSIFDEIITGFRVAPGGAREKYRVQPDLSCYGKALGNGMPISAVAGHQDIMAEFGEVFISGTYGGEALSLAAARAVLDVIAGTDALAKVAATGERLLSGMRTSIDRHGVGDRVRAGGEPSRPVVTFTGESSVVKSWFQQCLAARGVLFNGVFHVCARHNASDVQAALEAFDAACAGLAEHDDLGVLLVGEPVAPAVRPLLP